ncbi:MAG TPA: sigma-70 family RNA polymerase sigma factor [Opitutales bacterium]|nr:sigma-70 family RNA polymerase sigma factor [Opitutales bacterium]
MDAALPAIFAMDDTLQQDDASARTPIDADSALMMRVREGDEKALAELIDRWKTPLINFFYRSINSYAQAEDLAQMTFVRIYRSAPRYEPRAKFSTYLFHVARRLLINEYRHRQRKPLETVDPADLHAVSDNEEARDVSEIEEAFNQAIGNLPEKHATALLLLKQQELSYDEIAVLMDASVGAVKTWIFRARAQLREELGGIL